MILLNQYIAWGEFRVFGKYGATLNNVAPSSQMILWNIQNYITEQQHWGLKYYYWTIRAL